MRFLDGLHRERYLVLRGLRLAQQRLAGRQPGAGCPRLEDLIEFLDVFALQHFLARELALLEHWERRHPRRTRVQELSTLRQDRHLGQDLVQCLLGALAPDSGDPERVRVDLGRLITHLSRTLVRGERAVASMELALADADEELLQALGESLSADEDVERRYLAVIQVLETGECEDEDGTEPEEAPTP